MAFFILLRPWISFFYLLATLVVLNSKEKKKNTFFVHFFLNMCILKHLMKRHTPVESCPLSLSSVSILLPSVWTDSCATQSTSVYASQVSFINRCVIESSLQWSWLCWNSYYSKRITEPSFLHIQNTTYSTRLWAQITWSQNILLVRRSFVFFFWMIFSSCLNNSLGPFLYLVPVVAWTTLESVILQGDFSSCCPPCMGGSHSPACPHSLHPDGGMSHWTTTISQQWQLCASSRRVFFNVTSKCRAVICQNWLWTFTALLYLMSSHLLNRCKSSRRPWSKYRGWLLALGL